LERIFLVTVVVEGRESDPALMEELEKIDSGGVPHWHGLRADMHLPGESDADDKAAHGSRIQVLFNQEPRGVAESRSDAVQFAHLLSEKHESMGLKSPQEDLLLLLLKSGAQFADREWLHAVTGALIVPPPLISSADRRLAAFGAMKLANAVVFNTEGLGKRTSFDVSFAPIISHASAVDINLSDGNSYPTPVWNGGAIAMRLNTFRNLPAQDPSLTEEWPANLELSLNLWLCADGMDMIKDLEIIDAEPMPHNPLSPEMTARFAAAWMDEVTVKQIFHEYTKTFHELTHLEFETLMSKARGSEDFPIELTERCRSFSWYAHHVNTDITETLDIAGEEIQKEEKKQKEDDAAREIEKKMQEQQERMRADKAAADAAKQAEEEAAKQAAEAAEKAKLVANGNETAQIPDMGHGDAVPDMAHGDAVPEEEQPAENKPADENKPAEDNKAAEQEKPAEENKPVEENKPAEEIKVADAEEKKPAEDLVADDRPKPAVPLRPFNVEIVQKPQQVDLAFVDVSDGHKEHPHMGAKDENGNYGYVHDETALHKNPPPFSYAGEEFIADCKKRDNHWRMLNEKVRVDLDAHKAAEESLKKRDKIFCLVYTIESGHPKIPAIRETWG